ncbi:MAG: NAD(P)H-hydrate dehydratase [Candidatus Rokubacteria bacterium]|nr:NAD(P)H-hydrate dehydratase [Candidatus Rokubacteria bacterium]
MIRLATAEEMRRGDRRATERFGVPSLLLMENAGRGAADAIERVLGPARGRRVAVVCGKGNNGGDGFVVARHLAGRGAAVHVWLVARAADVRGDAASNLDALVRAALPLTEVTGPTGPAGIERLRRGLGEADLLVDALLGTGVSGPATGLIADAIAALNEAERPVCALDLPSGLSADHGQILGPAVRARLTVTFGLPKLGLFLYPAAACAGRVELVDLGVPRAWLEEGLSVGMAEPEDIAAILPPRPADAHKGHYGHLLVVAGSLGKTGAAVLAALGALRAGTGLVTCALPGTQQPIVAAHLAEAMTEALPETAAQTLSAKALDRLLELGARMDAVAVGPGVGLEAETQGTVRELVLGVERPMVVDADALAACVGHLPRLREARGPRLLTPHPGEAARLLGRRIAEVQADRIGSARALADASGAWVALKGAGTLVASPGGAQADVLLNPTGNPGMATGGMGDVLTGIAGGLLAQGLRPEAALRAAVYLHGLAGDLAAADRGNAGLLASDVAHTVPAALRQLRGGDRGFRTPAER